MLLLAGLAVTACLFSRAHCCLALSIWRRLLMQALAWEMARECTRFGMAIAANNPMIATTIMISTSVKPDSVKVLIFCIQALSEHKRYQFRESRGSATSYGPVGCGGRNWGRPLWVPTGYNQC